jgi:pimeloyl-ACP methyl ester carboxylesterase
MADSAAATLLGDLQENPLLIAKRGYGIPLIAFLLASLGLSSCRTPVGVRQVDARAVHRQLTVNALTEGKPSAASKQVLERLDLAEHYDRDPEAALREILGGLGDPTSSNLLFALAELSFLHAEKAKDAGWYFASVVSAYAFLFPDDSDEAPDPFDPRLRMAVDLYNRALTLALSTPGARSAILDGGGTYRFPFGEIDIEADPESFRWGQRELEDFVDVSELEVRGLRNRYRRPGIGAALAATAVLEDEVQEDQAAARLGERVMVPVTLFLRIESPRRGLREGNLRASLELYSDAGDSSVSVAGQKIPLEVDTTTVLAHGLQGSQIWDWEIAGFKGGDLLPEFGRGVEDGLFMLRPYRRGRIPLVLVHGTASSPARWAEMVNELESYPEIRQQYQIWLFLYATGNPVLYSANLLRQALVNAVEDLDPEGRDPALQRMVVIGHSQGGLLAKALVTDPGTAFWDGISEDPFDEVAEELDPETVELIDGALFFEPLPFVERVIFIATPHRGSFRARGVLADLAGGMVRLPGNLVRGSIDLVTQSESTRLRRQMDRMPSSVDNMRPDHRFTKTFSAIPVDEGVAAHSIIAVAGDGPPEEGNDGVVEYQSAHIDEAVSELVVRSGHSVQGHPRTILEVRRILLLHVDAP